jgi:hypothetical protein
MGIPNIINCKLVERKDGSEDLVAGAANIGFGPRLRLSKTAFRGRQITTHQVPIAGH